MTLIEQILLDIVKNTFSEADITTLPLDTPPKKELWDFAYGVFSLAKSARLAPPAIAEKLANALNERTEYFRDASVMGGYVNFRLTPRAWEELFATLVPQDRPANGETIVVDYFSANVGKPFHIGHLCTPSIGQFIINTHKYLWYRAIGDNHLWDWGGLFGKLIVGYRKYGNPESLKADAIEHLLELYIRITADAENDEKIEELCREEFKKLSEWDPENIELWKEFTAYSTTKATELISVLNVRPDYAIGESYYEWLPLPKLWDQPDLQYDMKSVVWELIEKGIATRNGDGSVGVVFPEEEKIPSCVLAKRDGTHLYITSDLACVKYRTTNGWNPSKIIYTSDSRQQLHFRQFFSVARRAWPELLEKVELFHAFNGFIKLKDGAMSTRKGKIIRLQDLIEEGITRTKSIIESKGQFLSDADIQAIAVGAIKYSYLAQDREKDVVFDWDKALAFEGNSGPYIQYSYVRAKNIIEKAGELLCPPEKGGGVAGGFVFDYNVLTLSEYDRSCLRQLSFFERAVADSAAKYKPHTLATYCYDLASEFNSFYVHTPKILEEQDQNLRAFRLALIARVRDTIQKGFELLAIPLPEKM